MGGGAGTECEVFSLFNWWDSKHSTGQNKDIRQKSHHQRISFKELFGNYFNREIFYTIHTG
jgi:hypothetical protein